MTRLFVLGDARQTNRDGSTCFGNRVQLGARYQSYIRDYGKDDGSGSITNPRLGTFSSGPQVPDYPKLKDCFSVLGTMLTTLRVGS